MIDKGVRQTHQTSFENIWRIYCVVRWK